MPKQMGTNHAAKLPERLRFLLCIFDSGEYCELAWLEGALRYRKGFVFKEKPSCQLECTPDPQHGAHFWRDLDRSGVWSWKPEYPNPDFLHGKGWQLEIARDGRTLNSKGDNGYPGPRGAGNAASSPFGQLIAALRALSGIKEIS